MIEYSPMTITELELRVATLEQKLAYLAENVDSPASADTNAWIDRDPRHLSERHRLSAGSTTGS